MEKTLPELRKLIILAEETKDILKLEPLPYGKDELDPVLSKISIEYHYSTLAKAYVTRYNAGEGDADFNRAGAFLHNIFFPQLTSPSSKNRPFGISSELINKHYTGGYEGFKDELEKIAMGIQGSGWVYLARNGKIKTIKNHEIKKDIVLLIDWWEHSYFTDYGPNKIKYLQNIWRVINWSVINDRINLIK